MTDGAPEVRGFDLGELIGRGARSRVWAAVDRGTGQRLAIKIVQPVPAVDPGGGEAHSGEERSGGERSGEERSGEERSGGERGEGESGGGQDGAEAAGRIGRLVRLRHPGLVGVHRVLDRPDGRRIWIQDLATGGCLTELTGPGLPAEQGRSILAGIARALARMHAAGLVHGRVGAGNVLFTSGGLPVLALPDAAPAPGHGPEDDVHALGRTLAAGLVRDPAAGPVFGLVRACLAEDPRVRPTAGRLADAADLLPCRRPAAPSRERAKTGGRVPSAGKVRWRPAGPGARSPW